jgi:hypothetical protein
VYISFGLSLSLSLFTLNVGQIHWFAPIISGIQEAKIRRRAVTGQKGPEGRKELVRHHQPVKLGMARCLTSSYVGGVNKGE